MGVSKNAWRALITKLLNFFLNFTNDVKRKTHSYTDQIEMARRRKFEWTSGAANGDFTK
ncbi:hypothetical protein SK128_002953 [Halocaridina rubra]|uniref:Uncharacterized protein n=1 Tax=Halocaridina rubra TaxID=373956 RepID=A0AAN8WYD5_HALRR